MNIKFPLTVTAVVLFFVLAIFLSGTVDARGRGGGGRRGGSRGASRSRGSRRHSRGGPAAGGGFSSRSPRRKTPTRRPTARKPATRQAPVRQKARGDRSDNRQDRIDDRQDHRDKAREDRQDFVEDRWDDHYDHRRRAAFATGVAVGAVANSNYVRTISCDPCPTVVVNGVTYYDCGATWYKRGNVSGDVVYVIVAAPAGH